MRISPTLGNLLKLDAVSCLAMAGIVVPLAGGLAGPLGIDATFLRIAAGALVPLGLFILWLGTRTEAAAALVWLVIAGNVGWAAASMIEAAMLPGITPLGQLLVAGQGLAVLALAIAEYAALRSARANRQAAA